MTWLWDSVDERDDEERQLEAEPAAGRVKRKTPVWSRRGLLLTALSGAGWLLAAPFLWISHSAALGGSYLSLMVWLLGLLVASVVSGGIILVACLRRSWGVALLSLALVVAAVGAVTVFKVPAYDIDRQYLAHRAALANLSEDYRAGRLDGDLTLPPEVRSICRSGFAYATPTVLFVQTWQNWRAETGTGLAYFAEPPTAQTAISTASGDQGNPLREVGDGWWWVA